MFNGGDFCLLAGIFTAVPTPVASCMAAHAVAVVVAQRTKDSRPVVVPARSASHSSCRNFHRSRPTRICRTSEMRNGKRRRKAAMCWHITTPTMPSRKTRNHPPAESRLPAVDETRRRRSPVFRSIVISATIWASRDRVGLARRTVEMDIRTHGVVAVGMVVRVSVATEIRRRHVALLHLWLMLQTSQCYSQSHIWS